MKTVDVHEARTHLSRLLERARAGEEIVITKNGKPYACLVAIAPHAPRQPSLLHGRLEGDLFAPLPEQELAPWEG